MLSCVRIEVCSKHFVFQFLVIRRPHLLPTTCASVQARIAQKDEALGRYQHLLEEARAEMTDLQRRHSDEMQSMQQLMRQKHEAAFKKYCQAVKESLNTPNNPVATNEQVLLFYF